MAGTPFRVYMPCRDMKIGIVATSLKQLVNNLSRYQFSQTTCRVFLEDGTLVVDEEYFSLLMPDTVLIVKHTTPGCDCSRKRSYNQTCAEGWAKMPHLSHLSHANPSRSNPDYYVHKQAFVPPAEVPHLPPSYYQQVHSNHHWQQNVVTCMHPATNVNLFQHHWQYPMSQQMLLSPSPQDQPFLRPTHYLDVTRVNVPFPPVKDKYPNPSSLPQLLSSRDSAVSSVDQAMPTHTPLLCIRESAFSRSTMPLVDHATPTYSSNELQHQMQQCTQSQQPQFALTKPQLIPSGAQVIHNCSIGSDQVYLRDFGLNKSTKTDQKCLDHVCPSVGHSEAAVAANSLTAKATESVAVRPEPVTILITDAQKPVFKMTGSKLGTTPSPGLDDSGPLVARSSSSISGNREKTLITSAVVTKKIGVKLANASSVLSPDLGVKAATTFPSEYHNSEIKLASNLLSPIGDSRVQIAISQSPVLRNIAPKPATSSHLMRTGPGLLPLSCVSREPPAIATQYKDVNPQAANVSSHQLPSHSVLNDASSSSPAPINSQAVGGSSFDVTTSVNSRLRAKTSSMTCDEGLKISNRPSLPPNVEIINLALHNNAPDEISIPIMTSNLPIWVQSFSSSAAPVISQPSMPLLGSVSGNPQAINKSMLVTFPSDTRVSVASLSPSIAPLSTSTCVSASASAPVPVSQVPVISSTISRSAAGVPASVPKHSVSPLVQISADKPEQVSTSTLNSAYSASDKSYSSATPQSIFCEEAYSTLPFANFFDVESDKSFPTHVPSTVSSMAVASSVSVPVPSAKTSTSFVNAAAASPASYIDKELIESKLTCTKLILMDSNNFKSDMLSADGNDTHQDDFVDASDLASLLTLECEKHSPTDRAGIDSSPDINVHELDRAEDDTEMEMEGNEEKRGSTWTKTIVKEKHIPLNDISVIDVDSGEDEHISQEEHDTSSSTESCSLVICPEDEDEDDAPSELVIRFHTACINGVITVRTNKFAESPVQLNESVEGSSTRPKLEEPDNIIDLTTSSVELHFEDLEDVPDSPTIVSHSICFSLQHDGDESGCMLTKSQTSQVVDKFESRKCCTSRVTCNGGLSQLL